MKNITQEAALKGIRSILNLDLPNRRAFEDGDTPECEYYEGEDFLEMDMYEQYYAGCQHDHKRYNWNGTQYHRHPKDRLQDHLSGVEPPATGRRTPWYLRRPYIREQLCPVIVDRFSDLLFSEQNRPQFADYNDALAPFFKKIMDKSDFWSKMLEARDRCGAAGTVAVGSVFNGQLPDIQILNAKYCKPLFRNDDPETGILDALEVMYSYEVPEKVRDRQTGRMTKEVKRYLYRRVITPNYDIVATALVGDDPEKTMWKITSAIETGLGFVPFVWVTNDGRTPDGYGYPDCDQQLENFDALDAIISQSFRGTLYNSDPTLVMMMAGDRDQPVQVETGSGVAVMCDPTLKEDLKLMEMNGTGPKTGLEVEERIRKIILRDTRCALPEELVNANTAAEIMARLQAMINRVQRLRQHWRMPLIRLVLFMIAILNKVDPATGKLYREGITWLKGITIPGDEDGFDLSWPALSEIDESKILAKVTAYVAAISGQVISQETAVGKLAGDLGVSDPGNEIKRIKAEREEGMADQATAVARRIIANRQGKGLNDAGTNT